MKTTEADVFGDPVEVLHVKGSGWDMGGLQPGGLAPLRLATVARPPSCPSWPTRAWRPSCGAVPDPRPAPSVESILHAILPFRFVLHTHADAVLALTNTPDGEAQVREAYGEDVVVVLYVMPGFVLARACAEAFPAQRHAGTLGMVLLNHGLFTFADDARTAYENHLALVDRTRRSVRRRSGRPDDGARRQRVRRRRARHRGAFGAGDASAPGRARCCDQRGRRARGRHRRGPGTLGAIAGLRCDVWWWPGADDPPHRRRRRPAPRAASDLRHRPGPATPDHVLRTKRAPLVGRDVAGYARDYQAYACNRGRLGDRTVLPIDPATVVLDPDLGASSPAAGRPTRWTRPRSPTTPPG